MLIAAAISFFNQESSFQALIISFAICAAMGTLPQLLIGRTGEIRFHEGLAISVFGWVITCLAGMIPYLMWGGEFDLANAIFESVSGYTTTGASILTNVEALPMGLLFWRSSTSFIGGVGIILFVLLILPEKGSSLSSFYRAEVSDLSKMSFTMRSRHITRIIVMVYFILIVSQIILLKVAGILFLMPSVILHHRGTQDSQPGMQVLRLMTVYGLNRSPFSSCSSAACTSDSFTEP